MKGKEIMSKMKIVITLLFILCILFGCTNNKEQVSYKPDEIIKHIYIGEIFKSGCGYIEQFVDGNSNIKSYPLKAKFITMNTGKIYNLSYEKEMYDYMGQVQEDSKYFYLPFSHVKRQVGVYNFIDEIHNSQIGLAISDYRVETLESKNNGNNRAYSQSEYIDALKLIKEDSKFLDEERIFEPLKLEDTIVGAIQVGMYKLKNCDIQLRFSKYFTHSFEYAGDIYVIDIIKDGSVIKTYEKVNMDGPY